jgi:penicillin amidase
MGELLQEMPSSQPALKPRRFRWLKYVAASLAVVILLSAAAGYALVRRTLPQVSGELRLNGLEKPVKVYRDERGVPHIEADTVQDLYRAQGYVTAQDRLWQMDLTRRATAGRLSEIFGESQIQTDRFLKSLLLDEAATASLGAYTAETRTLLEAYAAGVNAYVEEATATGRLPVEFYLLGYTPEPWRVTDTLAVGKFMAYDLGGNWPDEVFHYLLQQKVGPELTKQLLPRYPENGPTILSAESAGKIVPGARPASSSEPSLPTMPLPSLDLRALLSAAYIPDEHVGSNNWVVSGTKTRSGKPLLANDPHLAIRTPAIWHQVHLTTTDKTGPFSVIGATLPGVPGVIVGHNEFVAWGVTNTGPDVQDLYIERRNPQNPYQFEYMGKWEDARVIKDPIKVKGGQEIPFEVLVTRHGPIVSDISGGEGARPQEVLALRWTAHLPTPEMEAVLAINRAKTWPEFRTALQKFLVPTQNFVFAAVDGTIAYRAGGQVPIRKQGDGLFPVPGWTDAYEWAGFIPFDQMPEVVNPPEGFIATANNRVAPDSYPYFLTYEWAPPHRAARIREVLAPRNDLTDDDMRRLQVDYTNLQARTMVPLLLPLVEKASLSSPEQEVVRILKRWDFVDAADQAAPLAYQLWWKHLSRLLYEPVMGPELYALQTGRTQATESAIYEATAGQPNDWVARAGGLEKLAVEAFHAAVAEGTANDGANPAEWRWGAFHQFAAQHPIGASVKALGWLLNPPNFPIGGSLVTVAQMKYNDTTGLVTNAGPWRMVADLSNLAGNSWDILTPGESGHFLSPWYKSQAEAHAEGRLFPMLQDPTVYQRGKLLTLQP